MKFLQSRCSKKNKRGSMELSVNSIVILVIAVVVLGLILGFIKAKFGDVSKQLVLDEPSAAPADMNNPITLSKSSVVVGPGKTFVIKANIYNGGGSAVTAEHPSITCSAPSPLSASSTISTFDIPAGKSQEFNAILTTASVAKTVYLCKISTTKLTTTLSKEFTISVE